MTKKKAFRSEVRLAPVLSRIQSGVKQMQPDAEAVLSRARKEAVRPPRDQQRTLDGVVKQAQRLRSAFEKLVKRTSQDLESRSKRLLAMLVGGILLGTSVLRVAAFADEVADGRTYFLRYCASCHGVQADGHGYVAPALAHPPGDLRRLGEGNDTSIFADRLVRGIDGRKVVTAHGEREMPVWGERFDDIKRPEGAARETAVHDRINAIVAYLLSIQLRAQP